MLTLLFSLFISSASASDVVNIEYRTLDTNDGIKIQTCTRYPDPIKFPGKRPALMFIQGSGLHEICLRLSRPWATGIVERGVIISTRQKRGIAVDPSNGNVDIDIEKYAQNDIPSLKSDSILAFEELGRDSLVDQHKMAVGGGSEGAWMAIAIAQKYPNIKDVTLVSTAVEGFDTLFERQTSFLIPKEIMFALDSNKSNTLTNDELTDQIISESGFLNFSEIDKNGNMEIDQSELDTELRRVTIYSLATGDNTYFLSEFGGGVSIKWLKSAYMLEPLSPSILNLKMPVKLYHGREDVNTLVEPVYELEEQVKGLQKSNFEFNYYDDLGHALSKEVLYKILFDIADRLKEL